MMALEGTLCFVLFFPSYRPLSLSIRFMMDTGKTPMANRITPEEFRQYLIDIESLAQDFADARICVAKCHKLG